MITILVKCEPEQDAANAIRTLFCAESARKPEEDRNPLIETKFNSILQTIAQSAFDAGREFQKKHKDL